MQNKIEETFVSKFIIKEKRERYLNFISKGKTRRKFTQELYHFKDFDWKLFREISSNESETALILSKIAEKKNIATCHAISANPEIDGRELPIYDALASFVGEEGTILIFGNADVIYYEAEPFDGKYISI